MLEYLKENLSLTKNAVKNLKFHGIIAVNDKKVTVRYILKTGDRLHLSFFEKPSENICGEKIPIDILCEDENILAVNKPSGMATHPSQNNRSGTLANAVAAYYNESFTFRAISRLDKATSGIVLIAKNAVSAAAMCKALNAEQCKKTYYAVLIGDAQKNEDTITAPIGRSDESIIKRVVRPDGKYAETHYEILKRKNGLCFAKINIKTGRTHQIRVHMSYVGLPVYSDFLYGKEIPGTRLMLHCGELEFVNPFTLKPQKISCPVPDEMKKLLK